MKRTPNERHHSPATARGSGATGGPRTRPGWRRWPLTLLLLAPLLVACESQEAPYPFEEMKDDGGARSSPGTIQPTATPNPEPPTESQATP